MIQAERRLLQPGNRAVGIVVHDEPDDREIELPGGRQHSRILSESTVTDERDYSPVRRGELGADSGGRPKSHRGIATRCQYAAGCVHIELLPDTVLIPTDIGG